MLEANVVHLVMSAHAGKMGCWMIYWCHYKSSLHHATSCHDRWPKIITAEMQSFAFKNATRIHNLCPICSKDNKCSYELFTSLHCLSNFCLSAAHLCAWKEPGRPHFFGNITQNTQVLNSMQFYIEEDTVQFPSWWPSWLLENPTQLNHISSPLINPQRQWGGVTF